MPGARHFTELTVWKLADEIRIETFRLTAKATFARDLRARSQAEDAANSVCRNIAEGFGAETHPEFARFLVISRRSLNELQDILRGAQLKSYLRPADLAPIQALSVRFYPALGRLLAHLRREPVRPR
jgi:four helix bundle protein